MQQFGFDRGLALGYAMAAAPLAGRLMTLRPPWSVGTLAQAAGLAALADNGHSASTLDCVAAERAILAAGLAKLPGVRVYPGAANYLLVRLDGEMTAPLLQELLLPGRILIRDCSNFTGLDERFFRVAVRGREDNERLLAALGKILAHSSTI